MWRFPTRALIAPLLAFAVPVVATTACWSATEVVVVIETDLPCETVRVRGVGIAAGGSTATLSTAHGTTHACTEGMSTYADIGSLVLVPSGARDARVLVKAAIGVDRTTDQCLATDGPGCIVSRRAISFIAHRSLRLPVRLDRSCLGVVCASDETCDRGTCVGLDRCTAEGCGETATDAGGSVVDAQPPVIDGGAVCSDGRADCDRDPANGCEVNLVDASKHCGACGHDCGAAACTNGLCASQPLVSGIASPVGIAIAGVDAFMTLQTGVLLTCPVNNCTTPQLLGGGGSPPTAPVVSGGDVYFGVEQTGVSRCTRPGCPPLETVCNEGAQSLALYGKDVIIGSAFNLFVGRCPPGTTQPLSILLLPSDPYALVVDGNAVFITSDDGIRRCPLPQGCGASFRPPDLATLGSFNNQPWGLAVDETSVYWTESGGKIMRAPKTLDGPASTIATGTRPRAIIAAGGRLFWVDEGASTKDGSIHRSNLDGTAHLLLAAGQGRPRGLALGASSDVVPRIFWTNRETNDIRFVAR